MLETRPGVYFWQAEHPEWVPDDGWEKLVTSYALDDGEQLIVIDPLAPPPELDLLAEKRDTAIVVTCVWHMRDSRSLAERHLASLYVPPPDPEHTTPQGAIVYSAGERLPVGLEALPGMEVGDAILWSERHAAVITGDSLVDRGEGLVLTLDWAAKRGDPDAMRSSMLALLEREIDVVLPTHGLPTDRDALERAVTHP
jgi:glyoxylase-like metal-dependent hydrolase (beta-lactamase superfamily II)